VGDPRVDLEGYAVNVECAGEGTPPVVLAGNGLAGLGVWRLVFPTIAVFARTCRYEPAGTGRSGDGPRRPTFRARVDELHALLARVGLPFPRQ
jgi:pimeloyl-ACP methyl ester carboxylesterase